jgi:RHS repeat-associated protein
VPAPPPGSGEDRWSIGDYDIQTYRPRVDATYSRIERWTRRQTGDMHWRVRSRDNVVSTFGSSPETRILDPEDPIRIYSWLLEEVRDGRGNIVRYVYAAEQERWLGDAPPAQRYLKRVLYGNRAPDHGAADTPGDWLFEVVFDYGDHDAETPTPEATQPWLRRRDPYTTHRPAFCLTTLRLCRRVLMFHRFDELGPEPCLVKSTVFTYDERPILTRLVRIEHIGHIRTDAGLYTSKRLPPLEFEYTEPASLPAFDGSVSISSVSGTALWKPVEGLPPDVRPDSDWTDLDSRGLPDALIERDGAWYRAKNLGIGIFSFLDLEPALPAGATKENTLLADLGRGRLDAARFDGPMPGYWPRNQTGGFDAHRPFRSVPSFGMKGSGVHALDANGDGVGLDLLTERNGSIYCYLFKDDGFDPPICEPSRPSALPLFHSQDGTAFPADMSGDGLIDDVRISASNVTYTPSVGHARAGRTVSIDLPEPLDGGEGFDPGRIRFADYDGSGSGSDILYLRRDGRIAVFLNECGNSFSRPYFISPPDCVGCSSPGDVRAIDILGRGTTCLVWFPTEAPTGTPLQYCDLSGGTKPHILKTVRNNFGGEIHLTCGSSTEEFLRDEANGRRWHTSIPFPVTVIKEVRRIDRIGHTELRSQYVYRDGNYLSEDREFSGYAFVEQTDIDTFSGTLADAGYRQQPPTVTRTWFHTGAFLERERLEAVLANEYWQGDARAAVLPDTLLPDGLSLWEEREAARALRGRELRQEIYSPDGSALAGDPYQVFEKNHEVRSWPTSARARHGVFDLHPSESLHYQYERRISDPRVAHELVLAVDEYGNVTQSASVAYPRRAWTETEQGRLWVTVSETKYATHTSATQYRVGVTNDEKAIEIAGLAIPSGQSHLGPDDVRQALLGANEVPFEFNTSGNALERRTLRHRFIKYRVEDGSGPYPDGVTGPLALIHEEYQLALTPGLVSTAYGADVGAGTLDSAGYVEGLLGWYVPSGLPTYDAARFFLTTAYTDPHGNPYSVDYDSYSLLPVKTTDPIGNSVTANAIDYRALKPQALTDPNGDVTEVAFDELGAVRSLWRLGQRDDGDDRDHPGFVFEYDLETYVEGRGPVYSEAIARVRFRAGAPFRDAMGFPNHQDWIQVRTFTDGFGRRALLKIQAEPDADGNRRWAATGGTVYENKHGKPARQYEPRFSDNEAFEEDASGEAQVFFYDPLGRLIRSEYPDGTLSRVEFDAWREETWDQNDTVLESAWLTEKLGGTDAERRAAQLAMAHANTPEIRHLDALGRPFLKIADAGPGGLRSTRTEFDVQGNARIITDPRLVQCLSVIPDALARPIVSDSADAGRRRVLPDIQGQPVLAWDARDYRVQRDYDELRRPTYVRVRVPGTIGELLVERTVYGEKSDNPQPNRLRGRPYASYDGAGVSVVGSYALLGGIAATTRILARNHAVVPNWSATVGYEDPAAVALASQPVLEASGYTTMFDYDALGRVTLQRTPDGSETVPSYNEANLLDGVTVRLPQILDALGAVSVPASAPDVVVDIDYNARGQRVSVEHGNGVVTTYTYAPKTFRLSRQVAGRRGSVPIQDLSYTYDPVGNVVEVEDAVSYGNTNVPSGGRYEYDPLYQLTSATGREHPGLQPRDDNPYGPPSGNPNDLQALTSYSETYTYDEAGNLSEVVHSEGRPDGSLRIWRRHYTYAADSNRLATTTTGNDVAALPLAYGHDPNGNMSLPHLVGMDWNWADRLEHVSKQAWDPPLPGKIFNDIYFRYDASGQRIRKAYANGAYIEESIYLGALEIYRMRNIGDGAIAFRRMTLHVMDGNRRVALVETNDQDASVRGVFKAQRRMRYQLTDSLGTTILEIAEDGQYVISYEETYPYGESSVQIEQSVAGFSLKAYGYNGKERDDQTGLYYFGMRYYAAWLGRWANTDPIGVEDGINLFSYVSCNPIRYRDDTGLSGNDIADPVTTVYVGDNEIVNPKPQTYSKEDLERNPWMNDLPRQFIELDVNGINLPAEDKKQDKSRKESYTTNLKLDLPTFESRKEAMMFALFIDATLSTQLEEKVEWGGVVYRTEKDGKPVWGVTFQQGVRIPGLADIMLVDERKGLPKGAKVVALHHSHPPIRDGLDALGALVNAVGQWALGSNIKTNLSSVDIGTANQRGIPVGVAAGAMEEYSPPKLGKPYLYKYTARDYERLEKAYNISIKIDQNFQDKTANVVIRANKR